jgi:hypothetical protein
VIWCVAICTSRIGGAKTPLTTQRSTYGSLVQQCHERLRLLPTLLVHGDLENFISLEACVDVSAKHAFYRENGIQRSQHGCGIVAQGSAVVGQMLGGGLGQQIRFAPSLRRRIQIRQIPHGAGRFGCRRRGGSATVDCKDRQGADQPQR